jgi:hypothetical protein
VKLVDGSAERKAVMACYRSGNLLVGQWLKDRHGRKKYATLRLSDMGPFFASMLLAAKTGFKQCILSVLGPALKTRLKTVILAFPRSRSDDKI